jgi:hypothetical protein
MRAVRTLALKKEALFELSTDDLHQVAGGTATDTSCVSCIINPCSVTDAPPCRTLTTVVSRIVRPCTVTG